MNGLERSNNRIRWLLALAFVATLVLPGLQPGVPLATVGATSPGHDSQPAAYSEWPPSGPAPEPARPAGAYPTQLVSSTGSVRPDQHGPKRAGSSQSIPKHAYSPFDEQNNREYSCPPGGCDFQKGQVLIKLAPQTQLRAPNRPGAWADSPSLNASLSAQGVQLLEPVFPKAQAPRPGQSVLSPLGEQLPMPDLTRWYRASLAGDKVDVQAAAEALAKDPSIAVAEPDYLRKPVGGPEEWVGGGGFPLSISEKGEGKGEGEGWPYTTALGDPHPNPLPAAAGRGNNHSASRAGDSTGAGWKLSTSEPSQADTLFLSTPTDPLYNQQWHLAASNVPQAWDYLESLGLPPGGSRDIVVAVIDTGVDYNHPDLAANIWTNSREIAGNGMDDDGNGYVDDVHGMDAITNSGNPLDDHGHGTHVAGIIASQANNGLGGVGVAYNVQIMPIKAAQYSGVLASSDIAEAIYYAIAQGADVINMSFGGYVRSQVEEDALTVAFGQAVLVAAAGNDGIPNEKPNPWYVGPFGAMYPAAHPWVLGVMASGQGGEQLQWSNWDPFPNNRIEYELIAPGVDVWSTLPREQYAAWDGTSMATPVVSGIAALARTKWSDKEVYSSRFIMGQIAANAGPVANAYATLTVFPAPKLSYLEHWLFDTTAQSATNDDDGIVDAGETIDLAIVLRNQWGKADPVTATLQAWAPGAFQPDPYVTMITDTVDYGAIGSFNWDDNGLIYDGSGVIVGVRNPFRFTVPITTPNDHIIPFRLVITARNGMDPDDATTYAFQPYFTLTVQRGRELPRIISEDMTLGKDYLWLVPQATLVESGVTVTVTPGTQIQWGTPNPSDPYSDPSTPMIQVRGSFVVSGTFDEPVELFPSPVLGGYATVQDWGTTTLKYAKVRDPQMGDVRAWSGLALNSVDHSYVEGDSNEFRVAALSYSIIHELKGRCLGFGTEWLGALDTSLLNNVQGSCPAWNPVLGATYSNVFMSEHGLGFNVDIGLDGRTNNAFLSRYWNPDIDGWIRFAPVSWKSGPFSLAGNYWGTADTRVIAAAIHDYNDDFNLPLLAYEPILAIPAQSTYPFVVDVLLSTQSNPSTTLVSAEPVTFTVSFNRDMDPTVQPQVSFGPDVPMTDYTIHPVDGGWQDSRTWVGTFNINPITGDGYQLIRVAKARAADDPWLVIGDDAGRFRFEIITSGSEAMNLQATGGEGYIDLAWTQNDFDLLAGFNLYRATTQDSSYSRLNSALVPSDRRSFRDTSVQPGQTYYYKFTIVKSDMSETDFSNVASATPIDTILPNISHTPVTSAQPGLPLTLYADVTDNVGVQGVTLYFRSIGATSYLSRTMTHTSGNRYSATMEGSRLASPGVEYYVEATDGVSTVRYGRPEYPYQIAVVDRPTVTAVGPNRGPSLGGTQVTIAGSNFKPGASVTFGSAIAASATVVNGNQITATTPAHYPAAVDVTVVNTDTQSGSLLNGFTYESDVASLSMPETSGEQRAIVQVPINLANALGLAAADVTVTFDGNVLSGHGARVGTLTPGWSLAANTTTSGQIRLALASTGGTVSGSGSLAILEFEVVGSPGSSSILHLASVSLNDGAIPLQTSDGSFAVNLAYRVAGEVRFWNGGAGLPGVSLRLEGDRVYTGTSDATGAYTVTGVPAGSYTLVPSKSDGAGSISAYDASLVLQHAVGLIGLSGYAAMAADVNKSGAINSMDAYYILQKAVDLITLPFPGAGRVWEFSPANRSYSNLSADQSGQDFTAVLLGDVSGNWSAGSGGSRPSALSPNSASVTIRGGPVDPSGIATATLWLENRGAQVRSLDLEMTYDPSQASVLSVSPGLLSAGFSQSVNTSRPGRVQIALAGTAPVSGSGELFTITFLLANPSRGGTQLSLGKADLDEGAVAVQTGDARLGMWRLFMPEIFLDQTAP